MITYFFIQNAQIGSDEILSILAWFFYAPVIILFGGLDLIIISVLAYLFFVIELYLWLPLVAVVYAVCGVVIYKETTN